MTISEKYTQFKHHVSEHKNEYIAGTAGVAIGAAGLFVATGGTVQIVDGFKFIHLQWKSPNVYQVELVRRGHPGFIIKCVETGEMFASQARAAVANNIDPGAMSKHLNGATPHLGGLHFERVAEAVA